MQLLWCSKCGKEGGPGDFPQNRSQPKGFGSHCKKCKAEDRRRAGNTPGRQAAQRKWRQANRAHSRAYENKHRREKRLRQLYGLTIADWDAMLMAQSGHCALCGDAMNPPYVDHEHASGKVRALLCRRCNTGLGMFRDNVLMLEAAQAYLEQHNHARGMVEEDA